MPTKRGPYSSPRQQQRQQRILQCARQAINKVGYSALTMKDIALASDVSIKTLYNLYSSKDELLLAAVADLLTDLANLPDVVDAKPGINRLLARLAGSGQQVVATPAYAEAMAQALFQGNKNSALVDLLLRDSQKYVLDELQMAAQQGELKSDINLEETALVVTGHQWSTVLLWAKGLLPIENFTKAALRSQLQTLIPISKGKQRKQLELRLTELN